MDEKDFELLEVLDETRNITHAADKLYMTQSALSKRIKSMEQELGVEILLRSRQGIRFTPAGEKVLEHSRAALKQMEQLRRAMVESITALKAENTRKLDEIRHTVDEQLQDALQKRVTESFKAVNQQLEQVYKGLGEMNPEQLWDTTMNPAHRTLVQVTLEDAAQAERMVTILMGDKVEPRRLYISQQANFNKVDSFEGWVKG